MPIHIGSTILTGQREYADEGTPFDVTLAVADTAEDLVAPPSGKVGRRITIVNTGPGKAYIAFDAEATTGDLELGKNDAYDEADIEILTKISFIGESGKQPQLKGILWSK